MALSPLVKVCIYPSKTGVGVFLPVQLHGICFVWWRGYPGSVGDLKEEMAFGYLAKSDTAETSLLCSFECLTARNLCMAVTFEGMTTPLDTLNGLLSARDFYDFPHDVTFKTQQVKAILAGQMDKNNNCEIKNNTKYFKFILLIL